MKRSPLKSTAVKSAGYDDDGEVLEIEFTSGRIYQFSSVPRSVYDWLLRAKSKGAYVSRIVNDYEYRDVTPGSQPPLEEALRASVEGGSGDGDDGE